MAVHDAAPLFVAHVTHIIQVIKTAGAGPVLGCSNVMGQNIVKTMACDQEWYKCWPDMPITTLHSPLAQEQLCQSGPGIHNHTPQSHPTLTPTLSSPPQQARILVALLL